MLRRHRGRDEKEGLCTFEAMWAHTKENRRQVEAKASSSRISPIGMYTGCGYTPAWSAVAIRYASRRSVFLPRGSRSVFGLLGSSGIGARMRLSAVYPCEGRAPGRAPLVTGRQLRGELRPRHVVLPAVVGPRRVPRQIDGEQGVDQGRRVGPVPGGDVEEDLVEVRVGLDVQSRALLRREVGRHTEVRYGDPERGVAGHDVVVHPTVARVLELEAAHVPRGQVVVHADVVRLPDVDARVVRARCDVVHDLAGAAVGGEDAVLGVVVHRVARDPPVVDAEKEDTVAVEAVDGKSPNQRAAHPLALVGEAIGARGAGPVDGD